MNNFNNEIEKTSKSLEEQCNNINDLIDKMNKKDEEFLEYLRNFSLCKDI